MTPIKPIWLIVGSCLFLAMAGVGQIPDPHATVMLTSAPPYSATGELFIHKADTNTVALQNPVLVIEGFDINNSMNWPELYELLNQENLVNDIQAYGRDLLVLNFIDSTIDIFGNAALTESAIAYINANRADSADKFTAIGSSLGGVTLRIALIKMPDHDIDTWISFDAPHNGANIPLGVQEYLEFFGPHNAAAEQLLTVLDRPATRQLLLVHHSHADGLADGSAPERTDFQAALDTLGYPTNCKSVAVSNGSGFGERFPLAPGEQVIHWTHSGGFFDPDIEADVYALPAASDTVFAGEISLFFPIDSATVNAYHPYSYDNAPGGGRSTFYQLYTNIPPEQLSSDDFCAKTNHCFIPTVSALGIPIENLASNLAAHASLTALSPFDEIHYAADNEQHVEINAHNKRWMMRALLEEIDTDSDGLDDYEEFLLGTDYASAASTLQVVQSLIATNGALQLSWETLPNTQYEIRYTGGLTNTWTLIETIPPSTNTPLMREYLPDTTGYFQVTAYPLDPVND